MVYVRGNTVYGRGATLEMMINFAYKRFPFADGKLRELEGPAWIRSTRYDVIAKPARPATQAEQRLMMRNMLAERFGLVVHVEDRPTDVYVLEVGKKGPKLVESSEPPDHVRLTGTWELKSKAGTMDELAFQISLWVLHCPVLNQTGLTGHYKFRLEYARPDPDPASAIPGAPAGENQTARASSDAPSIFNAIQQELGLKLSPRKMPLPVLIVDHAEPPTEN